jgi:hypothetical protein
MKKYKALQLGLQVGFPTATNTCNSWYLYNHIILSVIRQVAIVAIVATNTLILSIQCNSHATICNLFITNLHVIFPHTFQCGERSANIAFHPFVNKWSMLMPFATYLQLFYN